MREYRYPKRNNDFYLDPDIYDYCVKYARMLPRWEKELRSAEGDRREELQNRVDAIGEIAERAAGGVVLGDYLLKNVAYGYKLPELQAAGIPCGKNGFTRIRQRFYWELSQAIK